MPSVNRMTPRSGAPRNAGDLLRGFRTEQGMSQTRLAELASLSRKTICRIENGAIPSADTVVRLMEALDLPDDSLAPEWDLQPSPVETDYGARVRARRRALSLSQEELGRSIGVSASTLSRFERGIAVPRRWILEWIDDADRDREAIVVKPLAVALGFADSGELHRFCMSPDPKPWNVPGDRRSGLWFALDGIDPGLGLRSSVATPEELGRARYRTGNARTEPRGPARPS